MDEIKAISELDFNDIVARTGFNKDKLRKDYYLTLILYLIRDIDSIYFKGGTALNKIFLNYARLSEDLDFSLTRNEKEIKHEISNILTDLPFVKDITEGKNVDGFLRMIIKCKSEIGESEIFIDLNQRAKLLRKPESYEIKHFYEPFIPKFSIKTIAKEELIAEKVAATIRRNKPRDHYDVYKIIHQSISINLELVKKKCHESGDDFSILKMFNKAKMLKNRWDKDITSLIAEPVSFKEVMQLLAKHFKLNEEKEKSKNK
ncbi:MAG TPA: nucleotidyl transferase AbiEii/AbiGii toxin family protein [Candidatus Paceibacterota bacterium]|nr:nucleotidyl transferase AbiEii/AbiGii toxin family protein [Candidatus Paceibacterota bacterium]